MVSLESQALRLANARRCTGEHARRRPRLRPSKLAGRLGFRVRLVGCLRWRAVAETAGRASVRVRERMGARVCGEIARWACRRVGVRARAGRGCVDHAIDSDRKCFAFVCFG